jgi:hypothetical protein
MEPVQLKKLRTYNKPDLNAPRYREECARMDSKQQLQELREKYPNIKNYTDSQIKNIFKEFNSTTLAEYIRTEREPIEFPFSMGHMFLGSYGKWSDGRVDKKLSTNIGLEAHHRNGDSDGYGLYIFWTASGVTSKKVFANNHMWGFTPCRNLLRGANAAVRAVDGMWKTFIPVRNSKFLRRDVILGKTVINNKMFNQEEIDKYDEFSFD